MGLGVELVLHVVNCHELLSSLSASEQDYVTVTPTLEFSPGVTQLSVSVTALTDSVVENAESFSAVLSNPSAGATLGEDTADIEILDATG